MKSHLVILLAIALVVCANENPENDISKVKIIDNSRVLMPEEVAKLPDKDKIPVVVPLAKSPSIPGVIPKIGVVVKSSGDESARAVVDQKAAENSNVNNEAKLPPIPIIMPSFLSNVFDQPIMDDSASSSSDSASSGDDKPSGILNVLVLRSHRVEDSSNPEGGVKSSFVIMRFLPKSIGNFFGLDSENNEEKLLGGGDDDVDKKRVHLFGGDDDVDHKRMHLLGGGDNDVDKKRMMNMMGGDDDPDHMRLDRISLDESSKGVFTGGNEDIFSNTAEQQHKIFVFSMFDRLRSMFDNMRQTFEQQIPSFSSSDASSSAADSDASKIESVMPFISIRTDDGQSALIPNDIGYAEKQQHEQSLNKCMMLQFMRLKASMYYRTILHLLFFTGVLLFIFSLFMLMVRACRRRQLARRHPHHHHHHHHRNMSIASIASVEAGKAKLAAYKAWQGIDQSSLIDSDKVVLIQAPPAYDQVFIHDKNSTLTSSAARPSFGACQSSDECETKSLPPDYDEHKPTAATDVQK